MGSAAKSVSAIHPSPFKFQKGVRNQDGSPVQDGGEGNGGEDNGTERSERTRIREESQDRLLKRVLGRHTHGGASAIGRGENSVLGGGLPVRGHHVPVSWCQKQEPTAWLYPRLC